MVEIFFKNPVYLWTLISIPILIIIHFLSLNYYKTKAFEFANFAAMARIAKSINLKKNITLLLIRVLTIICIILAVSGTVLWYVGEGTDFDFILATDTSSSMLSNDYNPNRLEAAKKAAIAFVENLPRGSSAAILTFAGTSFVKQSLTEEKELLVAALKDIQAEDVGGTDLGEAIVVSSNLLVNSKKGKVVILLTDGKSNVGVPVETGIEYAKNNQIIVHTIGIGSEEGGILEPTKVVLKLDEVALKKISADTSGFYYRVFEDSNLIDAFNSIISTTPRKIPFDLTAVLLFSALFFSLLDWVLMNTKFKRIP